MRTIKFILIGLLSILFHLSVVGQNFSVNDGSWRDGANWSLGVPPDDNGVVVATNDMNLDKTIKVVNSGDYNISGTLTDTVGGSAFNINASNNGVLDISANVTIEGDFRLSNNAKFYLRSGDTLIVGGNAFVSNSVEMTIEEHAVFIINGDLKMTNTSSSQVDGNIFVNGDSKFTNSSIIYGNGSFQSNGKMEFTNSATVFGSNVDCASGPCQYGSGSGLPITLASFTVQQSSLNKRVAEVKWTTQSEINNEYFTLAYSTDGKHFEEVAQLKGAGNSIKELNYKVEVPLQLASIHYFRLSQTDFDGSSEQFDPIALNSQHNSFKLSEEAKFKVYPNPSNGEKLQLSSTNLENGNYHLLLFNSNGKIVIEKDFIINENEGLIQTELIEGLTLSKGVYFLKIQSDSNSYSQKVIIQ